MPIRVLLVDESEELRTLLKFPLLYAGFDILEAQDAMEAMGMLVHETVEVVVTDWEMPQMNGLDFVRKIRQTPHIQTLPVILLIKENQAHMRKDLKTIGVSDTLIRPDEIYKLVEKIKKVVHE